MTNLYHIMHKMPALEREDMYIELEALAQALVKSGLFRVDAYDRLNFARFSIPQKGINMMFSRRELVDENLLPRTKKIIEAALRGTYRRSKKKITVESEIQRLKNEVAKFPFVDYSLEIKLARILIQSAHPVVIMLILYENVQVFFSFSYNIGDMLDVVSWQANGRNSGMQSTDGKNVAIFVSAGGNPLDLGKKKKQENEFDLYEEERSMYGDGKPALARAMIIAGQEIGHYSDIMRDGHGRQYSKHSADFGGNMAKENVRVGRLEDIKNVNNIMKKLDSVGLSGLVSAEKSLKFYRKQKITTLKSIYYLLKSKILKRSFVSKAPSVGFTPIDKFKKDRYTGLAVFNMLQDMAFNLAPQADVYQSDDKNVEEAIACIEALARVPQQVNKWGWDTTKLAMRDLFTIYYDQVIPADIHDYERLTGQKFTLYWENLTKMSWIQRKAIKLKRRIKKMFKGT